MSIETAEIVKYAANTFLATKISFANEIASLCERIPGVDVKQVFEAVGLDFRINPRFLNAGAGFGGSCFPKDLNAIIAYAKKLSIKPIILESVVERNNLQSRKIAETVRDVLGDLNNKRIAILGLAFKPETDDLREAASIRIINHLKAIGAGAIVGYDPQAMGAARELLEDKIEYASSVYECIKNADACIIVTEWEEFRKLSPSDFVAQMRTPVLIDARRIYDPKLFAEKMTFRAIGLGEPKIETKNL
jgi:UDPglucose 6-dehydrogenase